MKFFLLFITILVFSITFPEFLIAQKSPAAFGQEKEQATSLNQGRETMRTDAKKTRDTVQSSALQKLEEKVLQQIGHEIQLSGQIMGFFRKTESIDWISLEASLVDLRGQSQGSYDRLIDGEVLFEKYQTFYDLLLIEYIGKLEKLLDSRCDEKTKVLKGKLEEDVQLLRTLHKKLESHQVKSQ